MSTHIAPLPTRQSRDAADMSVVAPIEPAVGVARDASRRSCITLFLPVRSSLYAVFPSVGVVLIAATLINRLVEHQPVAAVNRLAWFGMILLYALLPVYLERNERWVELARVSRQVTMALHRLAPELDGKIVTIVDDMSTRANLTNAWAGATREMSELEFGGTFRVMVVKPSGLRVDDAPGPVFTLRSGALAPVTTAQGEDLSPTPGRIAVP